MLKKSLAWVLTLALLLSTLSGLALISSAATPFAYASFVSGEALFKGGATQRLEALNTNGGFKDMATITGNADDRYAFFMTDQNDQFGISIPATSGIGANATIEVKFWASALNLSGTRLGMNFTSGSHNKQNNDGTFGSTTDYSWITLRGTNGAETVALSTDIESAIENATVTMAADNSVDLQAEGWKIMTLELNDFVAGELNFVNWSNSNGNNTGEGWYIDSILVYNTGERPADAVYGIREDVVGYYDFAYGETNVLKVEGGEEAKVDGDTVQKLAKADGYKLTVTAEQTNQPAVMESDKYVTLMAEVKEGDDGAWKVMRKDLTDPAAIAYDFGELLFADCTADTIYVRKVVLSRTINEDGAKLIEQNASDSAYVNYAYPYYQYNDFDRVTSYTYNTSYDYEGDDALVIETVEGQNAVKAASGYLRINVDDAFTTNAGAPVADLRIDITYLDKGTGTLAIDYNKAIPEGAEDAIEYQFARQNVATLTDSGEWKTATIYLSDAAFRNMANGADFRIPMGDIKDAAVASVVVTVGADKAELTKWINKAVNTFAYTAEAVAAFTAAQTAATTVNTNKYATAAQVATALEAMKTAHAALADNPSTDVDTRFTLTDAIWTGASKDAEGNVTCTANGQNCGSIVKEDGWFCWAFPTAVSGRYIGIAPENEDLFAESTSVTYEYDIKFKTTCGNDRVFLGYGSNKFKWVAVNDRPEDEQFNGFQAAGAWNPTPVIGTWGTIKLVNNDYSNEYKSDMLAGAISTLGVWIDNDDKTAQFFVRAIRVYDTEDPTKEISLEFHEDVTVLDVTADEDVELAENEGYESYALENEDSLKIGTAKPIADQVVASGENNVTVAIEYYLPASDNADEALTLTYGDGKSVTKAHDELTIRNNWIRTSFQLDDANFGSVEDLVLSYTGDKIYIRGIKVYTETSEKPAAWGTSLLTQDAKDHAYVDWSNCSDTNAVPESYGITYTFSEGTTATAGQTTGDRWAMVTMDDKLYITVDDSVVDDTVKYVRVDITHTEGSTLYIEYNRTLPEGVDDSVDPALNMYRFYPSQENKALKDVTDEVTGETTEQFTWITTDTDYVNPLGIILPTKELGEDIEWVTTSIYLNDAQFRAAANGYDFRIITVDFSEISRVEVRAITEEDYNAAADEVGDMTALKAKVAEMEAAGVSSAALSAAKDFITYGSRASQEEIDAVLETLAGTPGDVNGDGEVNTTDARLVLQYSVNKITADALNLSVADVNGDGTVNTSDARLILQKAVNKIPSFPIEA